MQKPITYNPEHLIKKFHQLFSSEPTLFLSPGRINIIGEHTDYNEGFVLPAAINKAVYIAIAKRNDDRIRMYALEFDQSYEYQLSTFRRSDQGWPNYILGVVDQLQKLNLNVSGFDLVINGDLPVGAGLSSSAAVECVTVFALSELFSLHLGKTMMARIGQAAEHTFAGVKSGIMDQFASLYGKRGFAIQLDCRSLDYKYVPIDLNGIEIVLLNTNIKHSLASSEYNVRRQQCEQGLKWVQQHHPEVESLRDVTLNMLEKFVLPKDTLIYKRCKYVLEENDRVLKGSEALLNGNIELLGKKMFESHAGLSTEYEVSSTELDFLVDRVKNNKNVIGARMMGGGFGGCTINLVKQHAVDNLIEQLSKAYKQIMNLNLTPYIVSIEGGTRHVEY